MADYILAEEKDLVSLPDELTYSDGAQIACGFGTVYEGIQKVGISGTDAVLITGLGPIGLAVAMLARALGAERIIGIDVLQDRLSLAQELKLCDDVRVARDDNVEQVRDMTGGRGVERSFDCSGNDRARLTCIRATRKWGKICFLGEGGTVDFRPSEDMIHDQKTIYGSWVTSLWRMEELVEYLVRRKLHPDVLITHRFTLEQAAEAYAVMASGRCGKVAVVFDEEVLNVHQHAERHFSTRPGRS
jgi:threonine dehydrogenase-like Zn-dependent dehydrogenase